MSKNPHIGIVIGSTRQGRFSERAAAWFQKIAARRADLSVEVIDLRDYPMPFFDEPASPAWMPPKAQAAKRWAAKLGELDGIVFVTPEYNHGYSAVLKNALDYAYQAYNRKPAAFVGYGGVGAARAIEQLRMVAVELQMAPIPKSVNIGMAEFFGIWQQGKDFSDFPHLEQAAVALLDDLSWWSRTLQSGRQTAAELASVD
ncbi:NADPH-dependent FMN reductase [Mesorhizobium sp. KR1-2]|uniref:NADPH-dependent FMN reductase n=1 Tax=Mesorhizobium sp. KR1-2 TaxID=3156609 RepID=UPI0032B3F14B